MERLWNINYVKYVVLKENYVIIQDRAKTIKLMLWLA